MPVGIRIGTVVVIVFGMCSINRDATFRWARVGFVGASGATWGHKPDRHEHQVRVRIRGDRVRGGGSRCGGINRVANRIDGAKDGSDRGH